MQKLICQNCGYIGIPQHRNKGSGAVEIVLWFFFVIPGIIYSVWRRSAKPSACPVCKSNNLIPIDSPFGRQLTEKQGKTFDQAQEEAKTTEKVYWTDRGTRWVVWLGAVLILFAIVYIGSSFV